MKKLILLLLVLQLFCVVSFAQEKAKPTKQETLTWLNAKMPSMAFDTGFQPIAENSCLNLPDPVWAKLMNVVCYKDITNIEYIHREGSDDQRIVFTGKVSRYQKLSDEVDYSVIPSIAYRIDMSITRSEIDKVIKALKHLAVLDGAKLVKDDLF